MKETNFTLLTVGNGNNAYYQNRCKCGWVGIKFYSHDDYYVTNGSNERIRHLKMCPLNKGKSL